MLTTAVAMGLVALVFVIMGTQPGLEVVHPMAVVILGGLVTTTLVSLFVLPALYLRFGGRQPTLSPEEELMHRWAGIDAEPVPAGPGGAANGDPVETVRRPITAGDPGAQMKDGGEPSEPQPTV
jgi:hypothetical protein